MSTITTMEQGRAAFAYICATEGAELKEKSKEYRAYTRKLPMLIKTNGLGAAIAFAFAKGSENRKVKPEKAWGLLYLHIQKWLGDKGLISISGELAKTLTELDSKTYRAISVEVLALLAWIKRFAEALIDEEATD